MVSKSFYVRNGLIVGNANIDATTGNITTSGRVTSDIASIRDLSVETGAFSMRVTGPTPLSTDNSTRLATTAFVKAQGYLSGVPTTFATDITVNTLTIGAGAGSINTNAAVGYQALLSNSTGLGLVAVGWSALTANTSGQYNTAVGRCALIGNTTGSFNVAFGNSCLASVVTTGNNTAVGHAALSGTTGSNNTAIGYNSGSTIGAGSNNVILGSYSGAAAPISGSGSNFIVLSDGAGIVRTYIDSNGLMTVAGGISATSLTGLTTALSVAQGGTGVVTSTGTGANVLSASPALTGIPTAPTAATADNSTALATTAFVKAALASGGAVTVTDDTTTASVYYPLFATDIFGTLTSVKTSSTKLQFNPSNGTLFATIFQSLSDERLKTNVQPITDALSVISQLRGVGYDWIDGSGAQYGFIAQQVEAVIPEIVGFTGEYKTVNYSGVVPFLVEAMKQQQATIDALTARVAALEVK